MNDHIGIEIIGDGTEEVFPQIEPEIRNFIKSVHVTE